MQPRLPRHGAHQASAVGRVPVGPVDHGLDSHLAEAGNSLGSRDEALLDLLEVRRQKLAVEALGNPIQRPGERVALERPDDQATALLARVERVVRIAEDRQLDRARLDLWHRVGQQIMVLHRDDRQLDAGEPSHLAGPLARGDDDVLGPNVALGRRHSPATALADELRHSGVTQNGGAAIDGPFRERVRQARRIDVPVGRQVSGSEDTVGSRKREQLERPLGRDDLERDADALGDTAHVLELVQAGRASCRSGRCRTGGSRPGVLSPARALRTARPMCGVAASG